MCERVWGVGCRSWASNATRGSSDASQLWAELADRRLRMRALSLAFGYIGAP